MSDKSGLPGHLQRLNLLLQVQTKDKAATAAWLRVWCAVLEDRREVAAATERDIRVRVPSCGVVPVDQRERLKSERYGQ